MSTTSTTQAMLNQGLFEDQDHEGFFSFPPNMSYPTPLISPGCHKILKTLSTTLTPSSADHHHHHASSNPTDFLLSNFQATSKQRDLSSDHFGGPKLALQRSSTNLWAWAEVNDEYISTNKIRVGGGDDHHHLGVSAMKMKVKKIKARRKVREPRFCFKTMSDVDVLDDGYKWRKYGQKVVKNTQHPRSYYRCTQDNCRVKKRVERLAEDPRMVITTYEGRHAHSPSHDEDDSQAPNSQLNNCFW